MNTPRGLAILYLFRRCPYAIEARLALAVSAQGSFCPLQWHCLRSRRALYFLEPMLIRARAWYIAPQA